MRFSNNCDFLFEIRTIEFFKDKDIYIKKNDGITWDCFEFLNIFIINGICRVKKVILLIKTKTYYHLPNLNLLNSLAI